MDREYNPNTDPSVIVPVDENGLRLAPNPVSKHEANLLPKAVQPFEFQPTLKPIGSTGSTESTVDDFQPKKRDVSRRQTKAKRQKNIICGVFMLIFTAAMFLPYIFGACHFYITKPIILSFSKFNVFVNTINLIKECIGADKETIISNVLHLIPNGILIFGLIALVWNVIKSLVGIFGARRPMKYVLSAIIYFLSTITIFIMALVGVGRVGIEKIDFMNDFIKGYATCEYVTLLGLAVVYLIIAIIIKIANPERSGYLKYDA